MPTSNLMSHGLGLRDGAFEEKDLEYLGGEDKDLREQEEKLGLLPEADHRSRIRNRPPVSISLCQLAVIIFAYTLLLLVVTYEGLSFLPYAPFMRDFCFEHENHQSPLSDTVDISRREREIDTAPIFHPSLYINNPGPETDAAWHATRPRTIHVDKTTAFRAGLDESHAEISEKYGGGYLILIEGLHNVHCLDSLRQSLYWNYEYYHQNQSPTEKPDGFMSIKEHDNHCLDSIRDTLMCAGDVGFMSYGYFKDSDTWRILPRFPRKKMCRNVDELLRWQDEQLERLPRLWPEPSDYFRPPPPDMELQEFQ